MDDKLKPSQEKVIIKNCVESIMEDLDDYYFDELFMKQYKKQLIEFFTKISEEYSIFSTGFDFSNKKNLEKSTKPTASWTDIPEYKKILKNTVEVFIDEFAMYDYEGLDKKQVKKEITEHFDKFFRDPEFDRLISKATD